MPCSYLVKFNGETNYRPHLLPGCSSSLPSVAAINVFTKNNQGLSAKNFNHETFEGNRQVWVVSQFGVMIFEELYEVSTGPTKIIRDPSKPMTPDNTLDAVSYIATKIKEVPPRVIPALESLVQ